VKDFASKLEDLIKEIDSVEIDKKIPLYEEIITLAEENNNHFWQYWSYNFVLKLVMKISDFNRMIYLHEKLFQLSVKLEIPKTQAYSLLMKGFGLQGTGKFKDAEPVLIKAKSIAEPNNFSDLLIPIYQNLGIVYFHLDNLEQTLDHYTKGLNLAIKVGDKVNEMKFYLNLQSYFYDIADFQKVEEYGNSALELAEILGDINVQSAVTNNLGTIYYERNEFDRALHYFNKSISVVEGKTEFDQWLANSYMNKGMVYSSLNHFDEALILINKAKDLAIKADSIRTIINININLIPIYRHFEDKEKVLELIQQTETLCEENNQEKLLISLLEYARTYLFNMQLYKESCLFGEKLHKVTQKYFTQDLKEQLASLTANFEIEKGKIEKKVLEEKLHELELKNQQLKNAQNEIQLLERKNSIYAMAVTANHEINQPLQVISNYVELIEMKSNEDDLSTQKYVTKIQSSIKRISKILCKYSNIKDFEITDYTNNTKMVIIDEENSVELS
jgi:tetratricopeptide (TPR) repeat protein